MQRSGNEAVPGCVGNDSSRTDYCYGRPHDNYLWNLGNNGAPDSAFPLGLCEGDCDGDSDCAEGLKCFGRGGYEVVPGCDGAGKNRNDYCYDPSNV